MYESISEITKYKGNIMINQYTGLKYEFSKRFVEFSKKNGMRNYVWMQIRLIEKHPNVLKVKETFIL